MSPGPTPTSPGSTRRRRAGRRVRGTSRPSCAGGRPAARGRSGWTASSPRPGRAARARGRPASRWPGSGLRPAPRRPRRSGRPARGTRRGRRGRSRGGAAAGRSAPSTRSRGSPHRDRAPSPRRAARASRGRPAGSPPARSWRGSPGASAAADSASCTTCGVGSTGVPIERSTMPSGWARAVAAYAVSWSHGKSGQALRTRFRDGRCAPARPPRRHSSCSCGGSASTSGWSFSMTPILAAPPGEPRSSKKCTLAS